MSQQRLKALAMLSMEKDMVTKLNYEGLITTFAAKKGEKSDFYISN